MSRADLAGVPFTGNRFEAFDRMDSSQPNALAFDPNKVKPNDGIVPVTDQMHAPYVSVSPAPLVEQHANGFSHLRGTSDELANTSDSFESVQDPRPRAASALHYATPNRLSRGVRLSVSGPPMTSVSGFRTGSPQKDMNRPWRKPLTHTIPEANEGEDSDHAPASINNRSQIVSTPAKDASAAHGGVMLPPTDDPFADSNEQAVKIASNMSSLGLRPRQVSAGTKLGRSPQPISIVTTGPSIQAGKTIQECKPKAIDGTLDPSDDDELAAHIERARQLRDFIMSGALEDATRFGTSTSSSSGPRYVPPSARSSSQSQQRSATPALSSSYSQSPIPAPAIQRAPQQFAHGARVQAERVPHDTDTDPVVEEIVSAIHGNAVTEEMLHEHLPFEGSAILGEGSTAGVIRITEIPYCTTRQEIVAFFGRNARFLTQPTGSPFYAIHIMMERGSAKSMDCYVEFEDEAEAQQAVRRHERQYTNSKKKPRIGERVVHVSLSSQSAFMAALFPRAKCVQWQGQEPVILGPTDANEPFAHGFKGYITREEMHMVGKFATTPNRSRFASKHPQRTYESMITLINKYPWWAVNTYTIDERDCIFNTVRDQVSELGNTIFNGNATMQLTPQLLEELLYTALSCPAFSEPQRYELLDCSRMVIGRPRYVGKSADVVPFFALQRRRDCSEQLFDTFASYLQQVAFNRLGSGGQAVPMRWDDLFCCVRKFVGAPPSGTSMGQVLNYEKSVLTAFVQMLAGKWGPQNLIVPAVARNIGGEKETSPASS